MMRFLRFEQRPESIVHICAFKHLLDKLGSVFSVFKT